MWSALFSILVALKTINVLTFSRTFFTLHLEYFSQTFVILLRQLTVEKTLCVPWSKLSCRLFVQHGCLALFSVIKEVLQHRVTTSVMFEQWDIAGHIKVNICFHAVHHGKTREHSVLPGKVFTKCSGFVQTRAKSFIFPNISWMNCTW